MKYLKLFGEQCKLSVMSAAVFRANFWLMLVQSVINSMMTILCIDFIYGSVTSIAGWSRQEMIVLICTSLVVNQLYRGVIHFNQNRFVGSIGSGGFDRLLLRPVHLWFQVNTGSVDVSCLISALAPIAVLIAQMTALDKEVKAGQLLLYILLILNGVLVLASFMLLLYTLAFVFVKVDGLNNIYYFLMDIANKPKEMFGREFAYGFLFIIPAIPLANAPASILLGKSGAAESFPYFGIGVLFLLASWFALKAGLRRYTSASS